MDADKIADQYIQQNPDHAFHQVPLLPTSGIQLHLPVGTVTHKLKRELRLARTEPPLRAHLCERFGWSGETYEDIDWESFRRAMRRLDKHRTTLTKHVNNYAPVGTRVHRDDPKYPRGCSSCGAEEENADHLLVCPERSQWRKDCMSAIAAFFERWDTPLDSQELLKEGAMAAMEGRPAVTTHANSVAHIAVAQQAIGWKELFRGRLTAAWRDHQTQYLGSRATDKVNGPTWAAALSQLLLQQWYDLWIIRNGDRHGTDNKAREAAAKRQAVREVELLYECKGSIEPHLNWILSTPLEQKIQSMTYLLRAFISTYGPILKKSHAYQTRLETG